MKSTVITALVILNALLAAMLVSRYIKPNVAEAQARSRPGDYLMMPADFPGARAGAVVVLDSTTGELSAIMTDENAKRMEGMPIIRMGDIFDNASNTANNKKPNR